MLEQDAARFLGLTARTLRNYRAKGKLSFKEINGKTRPMIQYDQGELEALKKKLDQQREKSVKPVPEKPAPPRIAYQLSPEEYTELEQEAERIGMKPNEYARQLMREGLESRFQAESLELRTAVKKLEGELHKMREEFALGFEAVLEHTGIEASEAKQWVTDNLR